ncbi:MAG: right-handed parallel beta-helix repeat-containing protein, partial [bacterium]|nr:right-handed parallel beta-helix repeat-containing protein [bacterium]
RKHESDGIYGYVTGRNDIIQNTFSSNQVGVYLVNYANNYMISSNLFTGNSWGYICWDCQNIVLYRNLFENNLTNSIIILSTSTNSWIVNNTIVKTKVGPGILWTNSSWGYMYNNVLLSNFAYGIQQVSVRTSCSGYNSFYGNSISPVTGGLYPGKGDIYTDPLISMISSFTIMSALSPLIDSGTNIAGLVDTFGGAGPDMGWREACDLPLPSAPQTNQAGLTNKNQNLSQAVLAPNPFLKKNRAAGHSLTFFNLTPEFEITVFTFTGKKVNHMQGSTVQGRYQWVPVNSKGEFLSSGVYICYITDPQGHEKYLKLVIQ